MRLVYHDIFCLSSYILQKTTPGSLGLSRGGKRLLTGVFPYYGSSIKNAQKAAINGLLVRYRAYLGEALKQSFDLCEDVKQNEYTNRNKYYS